MALGLFGPLGSTAIAGNLGTGVIPPPPPPPPINTEAEDRGSSTRDVIGVTPYWPYGGLSERERERLRRKKLKEIVAQDEELLVAAARLLMED